MQLMQVFQVMQMIIVIQAMHVVRVMKIKQVMQGIQVMQVMPVSLAHLWVDFRIILHIRWVCAGSVDQDGQYQVCTEWLCCWLRDLRCPRKLLQDIRLKQPLEWPWVREYWSLYRANNPWLLCKGSGNIRAYKIIYSPLQKRLHGDPKTAKLTVGSAGLGDNGSKTCTSL